MIESVTPSKMLAILPGPRTSFLDHLIPLCHFWQIPLVCTDSWVYTCAQTFYPPTEILFAEHENFQQILSEYETFITVEPCRLHFKAFKFGEFLYKGSGSTIAGFHGNPLKFRSDYWIERYADEDEVLIYGQYLIDYLKEKQVWERLKKKKMLGNIRKFFYEKHKPFFDAAAKPHLFPLSEKKTIFWAPTWSYPANFDHFFSVVDHLDSSFQILIKLHPFMYRLYPEETAALKVHYAFRENVLFLDEIPLIYPLIDKADLYLGDDSSVAFDFLSLNRPLFFMGKGEYNWATKVDDLQNISAFLKQKDTLAEARRKMYAYAFEL